MELQVVTPEGPKVDVEVTSVTAPGELGALGILPGHRALLSSLGIGALSYERGGAGTAWLAVNGGYIEVANDRVIVITETAEAPDEIDVDRAKDALSRADKELGEIPAERLEEVARLTTAKRRAENRLEVARKVSPKAA
ncbi:MAG: ATP synthase F1 subunit epsilon [Myxococcota bacterium]